MKCFIFLNWWIYQNIKLQIELNLSEFELIEFKKMINTQMCHILKQSEAEQFILSYRYCINKLSIHVTCDKKKLERITLLQLVTCNNEIIQLHCVSSSVLMIFLLNDIQKKKDYWKLRKQKSSKLYI